MSMFMKKIGLGLLLACMAPFTADAGESALPDPLEAGWQGVPVCEKLHEDADHRILRCTFPPGVWSQMICVQSMGSFPSSAIHYSILLQYCNRMLLGPVEDPQILIDPSTPRALDAGRR